jgi:hypothetical protein
VISILIFLSLVQPANQACVSYEPEAVKLSGVIKEHTFAGPPNYESVAKGDVQLLLPRKQYGKSLLGRKVVVRGTLFRGHTGHHHTKVLLTVIGITRSM